MPRIGTRQFELLSHSACALALALCAAPASALAADAVPAAGEAEGGKFAELETITVTARKRSELVQDVPIAITAISAKGLEDRNITNVAQIATFTPNMVFDTNAPISGSNAAATVFIRGIGQIDFLMTTEPGVGIYVDGVYLARSVGMALDLVDVDHVEVLRGPQGTLFGRNTIGGAINIASRRPAPIFGGRLSATTGSRNRLDLAANLDAPLNERFRSSYSLTYKRQDGYVKALEGGDDLGDVNALAGRMSFDLDVTDQIRASLDIDATRRREASAGASLLRTFTDPPTGPVPGFGFAYNLVYSGKPVCLDPVAGLGDRACYNDQWVAGPYATHATFAAEPSNPRFRNRSNLDIWGAGLTVEAELTDNLTLKSITSYRSMRSAFARDADHSPLIVNQTENILSHHQASQELQLLGVSFDDRLKWVVGAYYFDEAGHDTNNVEFSLVVLRSGGFIDNTSKALFGQATFDITDDLHLTLGGRVTRDDKNFLPDQYILDPKLTAALGLKAGDRALPNVNYANRISEFTPYANLAYDFAPGVMAYASYSEGFKSGGFTQRVFPPLPAAPTFQPEFVKVYEAGFKGTTADKRLRVNAAVFRTDYSDIQLLVLLGAALQWTNAAAARVNGAEVEYTWNPVRGLLIEGGVGYLDAQYTELTAQAQAFGIKRGNHFINAPTWQISSAVSYSMPVAEGDLTPRLDWAYRTRTYNDALNSPGIVQKPYHVLNFNLAYDHDDWSVVLGVNNLTDTRYWTTAFSHPDGGIEEASWARSREWWLRLKTRF